jgi:hypothetical protein
VHNGNIYVYVMNNPAGFIDPNGMDNQLPSLFSYGANPNFGQNQYIQSTTYYSSPYWVDVTAWGAVGLGGYYESETEEESEYTVQEWTYPSQEITSQVPIVPGGIETCAGPTFTRSGLGFGLGGSLSFSISDNSFFTPGTDAIIGTGGAGQPVGVGGQGALTWKHGQSPLSQGQTSFTGSVGSAKLNTGVTFGNGPQLGVGFGLGGGGFYVQPSFSEFNGSEAIVNAQSAYTYHSITPSNQ